MGNDFGKLLRQARESAGRSVSEVSAYLTNKGVKASEKTIYSWETCRSQPTPDVFIDLCDFYGIQDIMGMFGPRATTATVDEISEEALNLARTYDALDSHGKHIVRVVADLEAARCVAEDDPFADVDKAVREQLASKDRRRSQAE